MRSQRSAHIQYSANVHKAAVQCASGAASRLVKALAVYDMYDREAGQGRKMLTFKLTSYN